MAFRRANPYLQEIIEVLDLHLEKYGGDHAKARERLSKDDNEWIDNELFHCITETRYFLSQLLRNQNRRQGLSRSLSTLRLSGNSARHLPSARAAVRQGAGDD